MRQDTLGVSRFLQFVLMGVVGEVALAGLITGVVFAVLHPPMLTSTAEPVKLLETSSCSRGLW